MTAIFANTGAPQAKSHATVERMIRRTPWRRGPEMIDARAFAALGAFHPTVLGNGASLFHDLRQSAVLDGRIDNRDELIAALSRDPGASDAELALFAHRRWGEGAPARIRGEFAYLLRDEDERRLYMVRDRLGIRPLYFAAKRGEFRVSSCIDSLFEPGFLDPIPDESQLVLVMAREYSGNGPTVFRHVFSLEPGCVGVIEDDTLRKVRYYTLEPRARKAMSDDDYADAYRERLSRAVRRRAHGKCAVLASGGLDSSTVAAMVARQCRANAVSPPLLLTMRFPGLPCDEREYSDLLAAHLDAPLIAADALRDLARYRLHRPPTFSDLEPAFVPMQELYAAAVEQGVHTVLTGHGSDDTQHQTGWEVHDALARFDLREALEMSGVWSDPRSTDAWSTLLGGTKRLVPSAARALFRKGLGRGTPPPPHFTDGAVRRLDELRAARDPAVDGGERARARTVALLTQGSAVPAGLAFDRELAARAGVELEHPFLDMDVVELLIGLPNRLRYSPDLGKPLLRRVAEPLLPRRLVWRRGAAEGSTFFIRVANAQRTDVDALFATSELARLGLVDLEASEALLARARHDRDAVVDASMVLLAELLARWRPATLAG